MRIVEKSTSNIILADGKSLMKRPSAVRSYSKTVEYDVSHFYQPDKLQLNMIVHYAGRLAGEIISFGFDTGFSAEKITLKPALFAGYTRAFQVAKSTHISVSMGGWFGGKVSHKPCRDDFEREYYCPTLTAWSDYHQPGERLQRYYNVTWTHDF